MNRIQSVEWKDVAKIKAIAKKYKVDPHEARSRRIGQYCPHVFLARDRRSGEEEVKPAVSIDINHDRNPVALASCALCGKRWSRILPIETELKDLFKQLDTMNEQLKYACIYANQEFPQYIPDLIDAEKMLVKLRALYIAIAGTLNDSLYPNMEDEERIAKRPKPKNTDRWYEP